jgi:hypothetical protein
MGYSVAVVCRSEALQKKMLRFLTKEARHPWQVFEKKEGPSYFGPFSSDLSYSHRKYQVGVDYGAIIGSSRLYIYTMLHWVALKVGVRRRTFKDYKVLVLPEPAPYILYDGHEGFPVICGKTPSKLRSCQVGENGVATDKLSFVRDLMWELDLAKVPVINEKKTMSPHAYKKAFETAIYRCFKKDIDDQIKLLNAEMWRLNALWVTR